ncbi:MAG: ribosome-recycling factor [Candidatus Hepatoplasma vulgare]|nr:MAG: ribosome-recycling factor [Candidatus Hepatoplasma sp.]
MNEEIIENLELKLNEIFSNFSNNINRIRAEGASPILLEGIHINYYGTNMPLNQLSNIMSEEGKYLIVHPYDKSLLKDISNVISSSGIDLSLNIEGEKIRVFVPPLTEEKRILFVKKAKETSEEAKIHVRNLRHEIIKKINKKINSEDEKNLVLDMLELKIGSTNTNIEKTLKEKCDKLMHI